MTHDVFLSYANADSTWVERFKLALEDRGIFVWLDRNEIRPGDFFARSIEDGIQSSRNVFVVLSPSSLQSNWVAEEYYRSLTLANAKNVRIIPIVIGDTEVPGFLSSRQYVRFSDDQFEAKVDRVVWPGITGKSIGGLTFDDDRGLDADTDRLHLCAREELGEHFVRLSSSRMHEWFLSWRDDPVSMGHQFFPEDRKYGVIFLDFYNAQYWGYPPFVEFILKCRNSSDGVNENLQFVIYAQSGWLDRLAAAEIEQGTLDRLSHYFAIEPTHDISRLKQAMRRVWNQVQRDLTQRERVNW